MKRTSRTIPLEWESCPPKDKHTAHPRCYGRPRRGLSRPYADASYDEREGGQIGSEWRDVFIRLGRKYLGSCSETYGDTGPLPGT